VALLCAEGGLSLLGRPTLHDLLDADGDVGRRPPGRLLDDASRRTGAAGDGIYADHPDPLVRYTLRPDSTFDILGGSVQTNALGFRRRPGPPASADALRVVVLGDSVAFGYGVDDEQTLAARLELHLNAVRGTESRPVACETLAVPSWNHRAAVAALRDHWDAYRPDIVVYVPVHNDLSDANSVLSTGQMRLQPDPTAHDPWLIVSRSRLAGLEATFGAYLGSQGRSRGEIEALYGPCAIEADLSPESSRRYDENAESIRALDRLVRERDARLIVAQSAPNAYSWQLLDRLSTANAAIPILFFERHVPEGHTLVVNNHPNARTLDTRAIWLAADLLRRKWLDPGAGNALPDVPPDYADLRMPPLGAAEYRRLAEQSRQDARSALHHEVDLREGRGLRQVYGGLNPDTTAGMTLLLLLDGAGPRLELRFAPLPGRADLYPIEVRVEVNGEALERLTIESGSPLAETLDLPRSIPAGSPIEVRLIPSAWCVVSDEGRAQVASFQPVRIACPPGPR
jgi:hypothetical protein